MAGFNQMKPDKIGLHVGEYATRIDANNSLLVYYIVTIHKYINTQTHRGRHVSTKHTDKYNATYTRTRTHVTRDTYNQYSAGKQARTGVHVQRPIDERLTYDQVYTSGSKLQIFIQALHYQTGRLFLRPSNTVLIANRRAVLLPSDHKSPWHYLCSNRILVNTIFITNWTKDVFFLNITKTQNDKNFTNFTDRQLFRTGQINNRTLSNVV